MSYSTSKMIILSLMLLSIISITLATPFSQIAASVGSRSMTTMAQEPPKEAADHKTHVYPDMKAAVPDPKGTCPVGHFRFKGDCTQCLDVVDTILDSKNTMLAESNITYGCKTDSDCIYHDVNTKFFGGCPTLLAKQNINKADTWIQMWNNEHTQQHTERCGYFTPMCRMHADIKCVYQTCLARPSKEMIEESLLLDKDE